MAFQCSYRRRDEDENGDGEDRSEIPSGREEWRLPSLFYADDLVLCGQLKENLRAMVRNFVKMCRSSLKVNADKSKVIVLNGEEGLE